jgi:hypothetical protein
VCAAHAKGAVVCSPILSLGRAGRDPGNADVLEGAADLGGLRTTAELLVEREGPRGVLEHAVTVSVDGDGEPVVRDEITQQPEIAVRVLLVADDRTENVAGGIVDGGEEGDARAAVLQPGVRAPIEEDDEPALRHALPARAVARGASPARAAEARVEEDAANRGQGEREPFALGQELGEVAVVRPRVGGLGERDHALTNRVWGPPR